MIRVTVFWDSDRLVRGIEYRGHACYDEAGHDIVCAAVSALTLNMANSIEAFTEDSYEGKADEEKGGFTFHFTGTISKESRLLMDSLILGLTDIREAYGNEYISIRYKEV